MDKKTKKRISVLQARLQKLKQQLSGVKQQRDTSRKVDELEAQIHSAEQELATLKSIQRT